MSNFRIAVLISGRGSNLRALVHEIKRRSLPIEIARVISDKPEAAGLEFAQQEGIPISVIERRPKERSKEAFDAEIRDNLIDSGAQLVVLAGYMRILGSSVIAAFSNKIINIHPSLLPSFPGLEAQRQALEAGVRFAGCTVHFVVDAVDAGPIIAQACVSVVADDTEETLASRILEQEHRLLPAVVAAIADGTVPYGERLSGTRVTFDQAANLEPRRFVTIV